jgi:FAD/FMN-containing dehydrogenase
MPCPSSERANGRDNVRWQNYIRSVDITVQRYWEPRSLQELVRIVQDAEAEGKRVHAVGAGYSFEDLAATSDWMVDLRHLTKILPSNVIGTSPESSALTAEWRAEHFGTPPTRVNKLVHVEAGMRLYYLCLTLDWLDFALPTMGGALGQHVGGAISTSTHGSDLHLPPLCDLVQAVHLVTTGGREIWIEAASRPLTDNDATLRTALDACPTSKSSAMMTC